MHSSFDINLNNKSCDFFYVYSFLAIFLCASHSVVIKCLCRGLLKARNMTENHNWILRFVLGATFSKLPEAANCNWYLSRIFLDNHTAHHKNLEKLPVTNVFINMHWPHKGTWTFIYLIVYLGKVHRKPDNARDNALTVFPRIVSSLE